jgi:hypothetical protein
MAGLLLVSAAPATGADLRVVASSRDEEISIDIDSIRTIEGSHSELRVLTRYASPQKLEGMPAFTATLAEVRLRCLTRQGAMTRIVFMASPDKVAAKFDYPVDWQRVDMNTDMGLVWRYFCTREWERQPKQ